MDIGNRKCLSIEIFTHIPIRFCLLYTPLAYLEPFRRNAHLLATDGHADTVRVTIGDKPSAFRLKPLAAGHQILG